LRVWAPADRPAISARSLLGGISLFFPRLLVLREAPQFRLVALSVTLPAATSTTIMERSGRLKRGVKRVDGSIGKKRRSSSPEHETQQPEEDRNNKENANNGVLFAAGAEDEELDGLNGEEDAEEMETGAVVSGDEDDDGQEEFVDHEAVGENKEEEEASHEESEERAEEDSNENCVDEDAEVHAEEDDHDVDEDQQVDPEAAASFSDKKKKRASGSVFTEDYAEVGVIVKIYCQDFMCHRKLTVDLNRNINFIHGQNGSGTFL
jgi:hypothetical protein